MSEFDENKVEITRNWRAYVNIYKLVCCDTCVCLFLKIFYLKKIKLKVFPLLLVLQKKKKRRENPFNNLYYSKSNDSKLTCFCTT